MNIDLNNLSSKQLWNLRKEITLGSLFLKDYKNTFGMDPSECFLFFDEYLNYLEEKIEDNGYKNSEFWTVINKFDTEDNLFNWYCTLPMPFFLNIN